MLRSTCLSALYVVVLMILSSCSTVDQKLCQADRFFCEEGWEKKLEGLSSEELYRLDQKYTRTVHGGHSGIEDTLAKRGDKALNAILLVLEGEKYVNFESLISNIGRVRRISQIDACKAPYYGRFTETFRKISSSSGDVDLAWKFEAYCRAG